MNIGKLHRIKKVTKSRNTNVVAVVESPEILFTKAMDEMFADEIFIPLELVSKSRKLEVLKVCTSKGIKGYAAFFLDEFEYEEVNVS